MNNLTMRNCDICFAISSFYFHTICPNIQKVVVTVKICVYKSPIITKFFYISYSYLKKKYLLYLTLTTEKKFTTNIILVKFW